MSDTNHKPKLRLVDWLALESNIRDELRAFNNGTQSAMLTLCHIDDLVAETTGRGHEVDRSSY
jgi:hypothetical protein